MAGKSHSVKAAGGEGGFPRVRVVPDQGAQLHEAIEVITSGLALEPTLEGIVRVVTDVTRCDACSIAVLRDQRLVVRAAAGGTGKLDGPPLTASLEGVAEWAAKTCRSVLIKEGALEEPLHVRGAGLDPKIRHSLASVPILCQSGKVIGTITIHAKAPHVFCQPDVDFLGRVARLVAAAVDNARLHQEAATQGVLLDGLSGLAEQIAGCRSVEEILALVPASCRALLGATRCEVYLLDARQRLVLRAADPARPAGAAFDIRQLWLEVARVRSEGALHSPAAPEASDTAALAQILWGEGLAETPWFAPLEVRGELLGLLAVLVALPTSHGRRALSTAASLAAIAIKNNRLQEEDLTREFFEALGDPTVDLEDLAGQAATLHVDPEASHVALYAAHWPRSGGWSRQAPSLPGVPADGPPATVAEHIVSQLIEALPGVILDRNQESVRGFLKVAPSEFAELLKSVQRVHALVTARAAAPCSIGLSGFCRGPQELHHGLREATVAAEVGALIHGAPGVFHYEDLGAYRYLLASRLPDGHRRGLEALAHHDQERGSRLFETLESYLDNRGNIVATARALGIHQNTLRQRLTRTEQVGQLHLDHEDWLSIAMALKVVKLHLLRARARAEHAEHADKGVEPAPDLVAFRW